MPSSRLRRLEGMGSPSLGDRIGFSFFLGAPRGAGYNLYVPLIDPSRVRVGRCLAA